MQNALNSIQNIRNNYENILTTTKELCAKLNIPDVYPNERNRYAN